MKHQEIIDITGAHIMSELGNKIIEELEDKDLTMEELIEKGLDNDDGNE